MLLSALLDIKAEVHKATLSQFSLLAELLIGKEKDQGTFIIDVIQLIGRVVTRILICVASFMNGP